MRYSWILILLGFSWSSTAQITVDLLITEPSCHSYTDGNITANPSGGNAPYQFFWSNGQAGPTNFGVTGGAYSVTVSDDDGTTIVANVDVPQPDLLEVNITSPGNICDGNMGTFTANVSGGTAPYAFDWSNGEMTQTVENLPVGFYFVTVTDINGCKTVGTAGINGMLTVEVVTIDVACNNFCDGSVNAVINGGIPPYSYIWSNGSTEPIQDMLPPGDYSVTVTDGNGCTATGSGTIGNPPPFDFSATISDQCSGNSNIDITVSGSIPPYNFNWSNGANTEDLENLPQGTYFLTITDANECKLDTFFIISGGVTSSITEQNDATCQGLNNGSATVSPVNGVGPFSILWSTNPPQTIETATGLAPGIYTVTVTDAAGCFDVNSVEIGEGSNLELEINVTQPECNGQEGTASVENIIGGTTPFSYAWSTDPVQMTQTVMLPVGEYFVTVTDALGCFVIDTVVINEGVSLGLEISTIQPGCNGQNGSATVENIIGGTAPYTYLWNTDPAQMTQTATELEPGIYSVTVTDANGCVGIGEVEIEEGGLLSILIQVENESCENAGDGSIEIVNVGPNATAPLTYEWCHDSLEMDSIVNELTTGFYCVTVTDAAGCTGSVDSIFVDFNASIEAAMTWEIDTCVGDSIFVLFEDVSTTMPASETIIDWQWTFNNGFIFDEPTVQFFSNLDTLIAELIVTSSSGCTDTITEIIPFDLGCDLYPDTIFVCAGDTLQIEPQDSCSNILAYNWIPDSLIIAGGNTSSPTVFGDTIDLILEVKMLSEMGCNFLETIVLAVIQSDKQLSGDDILTSQCDSTTIDFSVTNSAIDCYTWYFDFPDTSNIGAGSIPSFTYPQSGNYIIALIPNVPCLDTVFKEIIVNEPSMAAFIVDFESCQDTVELELTDNSITPVPITNWQWNLSNGISATTQNAVVPIDSCQNLDIQLIIEFGENCTDTAAQTVYVPVFNNMPNLSDTLVVCASGDTISINPGGNPNFEYQWSPANLLNDPTAANPVATITAPTLFTVVITSNECLEPCNTEIEIFVIIADSLGLMLPEDIELCEPGEEIISASTEIPAIFDWALNPDFQNIIQTSAPNYVTLNDLNFFIEDTLLIYTLATDQFGCKTVDSLLVGNYQVLANPADFTLFCEGEVIENIEIENLSAVDSVIWSPENPIGTIPQTIIGEEFTNNEFTVTIINDKGCTYEEDIEISIQSLSNVLNVTPKLDTILRGQSVQLTSSFDGDFIYNWTPAETLSDPTINDPVATPPETTHYNLVIIDEETECRGEGGSQICVIDNICGEPMIFVPNTFTPNGDGLNDVFQVRGLNIERIELVIFNRWGEKVFESRSQEKIWDGTFNGRMVAGDVYGFYLEVICEVGGRYFKKGNVTVIR